MEKTTLIEGELISIKSRNSDSDSVIEMKITSILTEEEIRNLDMNINRMIKIVVFPAPKICDECKKLMEYSQLRDAWVCDPCGTEIKETALHDNSMKG